MVSCDAYNVQVEEDPTGGKFAGVGGGMLNGAPHKLEDLVNFHVGDMVTSLQRATLQPGGREVLLYATIMGNIGACPAPSKRALYYMRGGA